MNEQNVLTGMIVDENAEYTLVELSCACGRPAEWILALVDEGIIEPLEHDHAHWRFRATCLRQVRIVQRLESDLGINLAGAALALQLLEEMEALRQQIR